MPNYYFKIEETTYQVIIESNKANEVRVCVQKGDLPFDGKLADSLGCILSGTKETSLELHFRIDVNEALISQVALALENSSCKLTKMNLSANRLGAKSAAAVSAALQNPNCKLTKINLRYNDIGDEGAAAVSAALQNPNCKLTEIDLGYNSIGDKGATAVSAALQNPNYKLTEINLRHNDIGGEGAAAVSAALKNPNCKLTEIDLSVNAIGDKGATAVSRALKSTDCKVAEINLQYNPTGARAKLALIRSVLLSDDCGVFRLLLNYEGTAMPEPLRHTMQSFLESGLARSSEERRDVVGFFSKSNLEAGFSRDVARFVA